MEWEQLVVGIEAGEVIVGIGEVEVGVDIYVEEVGGGAGSEGVGVGIDLETVDKLLEKIKQGRRTTVSKMKKKPG